MRSRQLGCFAAFFALFACNHVDLKSGGRSGAGDASPQHRAEEGGDDGDGDEGAGPTISSLEDKDGGRFDETGERALKALVAKTPKGKIDCEVLKLKGESSEDEDCDEKPAEFWMPCDDATGTSRLDTWYRAKGGTKAVVYGEFCPKQGGDLTVLLVIDFSGSMTGNLTEGPNDPTAGGTCGRLEATKVLVAKLETKWPAADAVRIGMVAFATNAKVKVAKTTLAQFKAELRADVLCGSDGDTALTNYKAALEVAQAELANVTGTKALYFVSDGAPTVGGGGIPVLDRDSHEKAGLAAADALRAAQPGLTFNAVFLGYKPGAQSAFDPQGYLGKLVGNPAAVRVVGAAGELVDAITALPVVALPMDPATAKATLAVAPNAPAPLALAQFVPHPTKPGTWLFGTMPFELHGKAGESVAHVVSVTASTVTGKALTATGKIDFKQAD